MRSEVAHLVNSAVDTLVAVMAAIDTIQDVDAAALDAIQAVDDAAVDAACLVALIETEREALLGTISSVSKLRSVVPLFSLNSRS